MQSLFNFIFLIYSFSLICMEEKEPKTKWLAPTYYDNMETWNIINHCITQDNPQQALIIFNQIGKEDFSKYQSFEQRMETALQSSFIHAFQLNPYKFSILERVVEQASMHIYNPHWEKLIKTFIDNGVPTAHFEEKSILLIALQHRNIKLFKDFLAHNIYFSGGEIIKLQSNQFYLFEELSPSELSEIYQYLYTTKERLARESKHATNSIEVFTHHINDLIKYFETIYFFEN